MCNLTTKEQLISSVIAKLADNEHFYVLEAICKMEDAWVKSTRPSAFSSPPSSTTELTFAWYCGGNKWRWDAYMRLVQEGLASVKCHVSHLVIFQWLISPLAIFAPNFPYQQFFINIFFGNSLFVLIFA